MDKLKMHSPDLVQENIERVRELFPHCVTEAEDDNGEVQLRIDFDALKQELSDVIVDEDRERYHINWPGKNKARLMANESITETLRPCPEESVNFDETKNLFIEGDNLTVLKLLQESYLGKVKMIYIDPPYNTGNDFIYDDSRVQDKEEFEFGTGQKDEEGNRLTANLESNGRFHSDWLTFIYPRLRLAKNLLTDDGVIFISIDDNEQSNLEKICNEIFGAKNFIAKLVWRKKYGGGKGSRFFVDLHEYVLVYTKCIDNLKEFKVDRSESDKKTFTEADKHIAERGKFYIRPLKSGLEERKTLIYPIECPNGTQVTTQWICSEETFKRLKEEDRIVFKKLKDGNYNVYKKFYEKDNGGKVLTESILFDLAYNQNGKEEIKSLFRIVEGREVVFSNPKPTKLISHFIKLLGDSASGEQNIVLDFFSGSATTAHATMKLNAEDGGNRQFICVQLPEKCNEESEAYKAGYATIAEISKERIRLAGKKILDGKCHDDWNKDIGFRVLKTDTSNMRDIFYAPKNIPQGKLLEYIENIKDNRIPEDLLFQVLLDWGVELTLPIIIRQVQGKQVFYVEENALIACFDRNINSEEFIAYLAESKPLRIILRDTGFSNDRIKINAKQICAQISPSTTIKFL